jgi:hypothetical protein
MTSEYFMLVHAIKMVEALFKALMVLVVVVALLCWWCV